MKIDIFNHILPKPYFARLMEAAPNHADMGKRVRNIPVLVDLDLRFRMMDQFGDDYRQVLSTPVPPIEALADADNAPELARIANDSMAELVGRYPDRFPAFVASLPMNNPGAALAETHRAIGELGARGVQIYATVSGKPLDAPEFDPIFSAMANYDLPIWAHPGRNASIPDYPGEAKSKYEIWWTLGWPYETSVMMARVVFSGMFDRFPELKIITHHMGGMIPYFEGRVGPGWDQLGSRTSDEDLSLVLKRLKKRPLDYFRQFYADTALFGSLAGTRCGLSFFGAHHVLFASDSPFDPEKGAMYIRETIRVIHELEISADERESIFSGNARRLLRLT